MNFQNLQMLITLECEKNITKTARKLHISQPALTYQIKAMEEELDVKILYRTKHGIKFTAQGEYLVNYATKTLNEYINIKDHLKNMDEHNAGIIRLGVSRNFARYKLPNILREFSKVNNKVQFNVITLWSQELINMIKNNEINIAIVRGDIIWNYEKTLLQEEPISVIYKHKVSIEELPALPKIDYKTDPDLYRSINNWWNNNFLKPPQITMELDDIETCIELVKAGLGYSIVPNIGLKNDDNIKNNTLKNHDNHPLTRQTWLIYKDSVLEYPIINKFITYIKKLYNSNF